MKGRTVAEETEILRQIDADRRAAELGMYASMARMESRRRFWEAAGTVVAGVLIMIANRKNR